MGFVFNQNISDLKDVLKSGRVSFLLSTTAMTYFFHLQGILSHISVEIPFILLLFWCMQDADYVIPGSECT